jgi:hypothetical protein
MRSNPRIDGVVVAIIALERLQQDVPMASVMRRGGWLLFEPPGLALVPWQLPSASADRALRVARRASSATQHCLYSRCRTNSTARARWFIM